MCLNVYVCVLGTVCQVYSQVWEWLCVFECIRACVCYGLSLRGKARAGSGCVCLNVYVCVGRGGLGTVCQVQSQSRKLVVCLNVCVRDCLPGSLSEV